MQAWEERAKFILNDINWLLCQSHSQFWNQVVTVYIYCIA